MTFCLPDAGFGGGADFCACLLTVVRVPEGPCGRSSCLAEAGFQLADGILHFLCDFAEMEERGANRAAAFVQIGHGEQNLEALDILCGVSVLEVMPEALDIRIVAGLAGIGVQAADEDTIQFLHAGGNILFFSGHGATFPLALFFSIPGIR